MSGFPLGITLMLLHHYFFLTLTDFYNDNIGYGLSLLCKFQGY